MTKPALIPLQQWVCDTCGELIEDPEHGYTEWQSKPKHHGFRIVHRADHSPRQPDGDCYIYVAASRPISDFQDENGVALILSFLDVGELLAPTYPGPEVANLREYVEFVRRLTLPYYEEARQYMSVADADGFFDGGRDLWPYIPDNLKMLIERYDSED